ncbi:MAG: CZB domain-containing protein [Phycisphaerales bacterium]|nr:MAG: CZB domain-containing protein [Phycisphaerales bacterium]
MSLDFSSAKLKHSMWKLKLRDFLDGKPVLTPAQATSHTDCDLGKWIYAEGLSKYGSIPEMLKLEKEHETLHVTIKTIVGLKVSGRNKEAEAEYLKVEPISRRIVDLLTVIESKSSKSAA